MILIDTAGLETLQASMELLGQATGHDSEARLSSLKCFVLLELTPADQKWLTEDADVLDYFGIYLDEPTDTIPAGFSITQAVASMPLPWDTAGILLRSGSYYRVGGEDDITLKANNGKTANYSARAFGINDRQFKVLGISLAMDDEDPESLLG